MTHPKTIVTRLMIHLTRSMTQRVLLTLGVVFMFYPIPETFASPALPPGQNDPAQDLLPAAPASPRPTLTQAPKIWPSPPADPSTLTSPKTDFSSLREGGVQQVRTVLGPLTLQLDDGRVVQLSGLECPDDDPYTPGDLAVQSAEALKSALTGQKVRLYVTPDSRTGRMTRMGHILAHLERVSDGTWVQGLLLTQGLARVRPAKENPQMTPLMMALEDSARQAKTGLWGLEAYRVQSPEEPDSITDGFQIVEGVIESVSTTRNRIYMNFGKNWKKDFTVGLDPQARQIFTKAGLKPLEWSGRRVRARGWVRSWNGPYMELDGPQSIELLDAGHVERMTPALEVILPPSIPAPTVAPATVPHPDTTMTRPDSVLTRSRQNPNIRSDQGGYIQVTRPDRILTHNPDSPLAPASDSALKRSPEIPPDRRVTAEPLSEPNR